jgi:hypothetical protein
MTQTAQQTEAAKVLPFRVKAFKIPAVELEEIIKQLSFVAYTLSIDAPLDWEDRDEACRKLHDALAALRELKAQGDFHIEGGQK